jgi:hypothetical protein
VVEPCVSPKRRKSNLHAYHLVSAVRMRWTRPPTFGGLCGGINNETKDGWASGRLLTKHLSAEDRSVEQWFLTNKQLSAFPS